MDIEALLVSAIGPRHDMRSAEQRRLCDARQSTATGKHPPAASRSPQSVFRTRISRLVAAHLNDVHASLLNEHPK